MPKTMQMLADHIPSEEMASRTYRYFQSWCGINGYPGCEAYFREQSTEEDGHMRKFQDYVDDIWDGPKPPPVAAQPVVSPAVHAVGDMFKLSLALEREVLDQLNAISAQAVSEGNFDAVRFLQPFQQIGIESIRELTTYVQQLRLVGSDGAGLLLFDSEIGEEG